MVTDCANDDEHEDEDLSQESEAEENGADSGETDREEPDRVADLFLTASEDWEEGDDETEFFVNNLIPKEAVVLLTGPPKIGKTTWLMHLTKSLAEGTAFLGNEVEQTDVLYLTEQRLSSLKSEYISECGLEDSDRLHYASTGDAIDLDLEDLMNRAYVASREVGAGVLIIDTFLSFTEFEDEEENSSSSVQNTIQKVDQACSQTGMTAILVHHDRKSGGSLIEASRGSNIFSAEPDQILGLRPDSDQENARALLSEGRFSEIPGYQRIALQDEGYMTLNSSAPGRDDATKAILGVLPRSKEEALKRKEILNALEKEGIEISKATVRRKLDYLVDADDEVRQFEGEGRGNPYLYYLDAGAVFESHGDEEV